MDLLPSEEQLELLSAASEFLTDQQPIRTLRDRAGQDCAVDRAQWAAGCDIGLLTLGLAEEYGGSGRPLDDEALLFRELGGQLAPGPYIAGALGARVAAACGDAQLAARIGSGEEWVGLAELRGDGEIGPDRVKGTFDLVDAADCDHLLLVTEEGAALLPPPAAEQVTRVEAIDPGTRLATTTLAATEPTHWVPAETERLADRALVLSAAMLAGLAEATSELATEHAATREQFGRPIGVNQAVKHACVDMAVRAEAAVSQALFASVSVSSARQDVRFQLLAAKSVAGRAAIDNAASCIQLHGGMGFTAEHDTHLYLKRAHVLDHLFAEPADVLAELLTQGAAQ
ncbi:acyl-CoA dehydrogenase family protein [Streptomyces sulphureus]|uniref:acyl-CoA dehydrogenase family protein n=1 Tax=Streptomyces sulphureus TaxID=47758 RepID=UPI000378A5C7|nr:acyl-CoA dehydrogenase family protein [Streptomyces sulphureus]